MKRLFALIFLSVPCLLSAQQISLPPSSVQDGVIIQSAGINAGANYWGATTSLGAYRISGDGYQRPLRPGVADSQLGLIWKTTAPTSFTAASQNLNATGGIVRVIFLGETAGWLNDFGYTYNGVPTGSEAYTAWSQIQSYGCNPNIKFGDYFDLTLAPGAMGSLDFWFSANGGSRSGEKTNQGGHYTLLGAPGVSGQPSQFLWANNNLAVNTWSQLLNESSLFDTYLIGMEDWRLDRGADRDYNDFQFAVQFLNADGTAQAIIPEPGQYAALAGMAALLGALWQKRRRVARG